MRNELKREMIEQVGDVWKGWKGVYKSAIRSKSVYVFCVVNSIKVDNGTEPCKGANECSCSARRVAISTQLHTVDFR